MHDEELKKKRKEAALKAAQTKGPAERSRESRMARWTMKHGKDDAKNPHSKKNYYPIHPDRKENGPS